MKKQILILLAGFSFLSASYSSVDTDLDRDEKMAIGERLYMATCASCHGINGETNDKMQLIVKPRKLQKTILTKEQSFEIIKHGAHHFGAHADIMPAFKYVYDDEQILSLAFYISQKFNNKRDKRVEKLIQDSAKLSLEDKKDALKVGKKLFLKKCALCHGKTGNGNSDYVEKSKQDENFIFPYNLTRTLLDEKQIFLYAKYGGHYWGTDKKDMPAWKKKFNDIKIKSIAKYIKTEIIKLKQDK
jgi:mono/diheme cytochrome c family protein